jgi:hypothetical protein
VAGGGAPAGRGRRRPALRRHRGRRRAPARGARTRPGAGARGRLSRLAALAPIPEGSLRFAAPEAAALDSPEPRTGDSAARLAPARAAELRAASAALEASGDAARWSLASELASEGDEEFARFGLAYRIPPRRARRSAADELAARQAAFRRRGELELAAVDARIAAAALRLASPPPALDEAPLGAAFAALALPVAEGKERLTDLLPERRALIDARLALLEERHARAAAAAELRLLTRRTEP